LRRHKHPTSPRNRSHSPAHRAADRHHRKACFHRLLRGDGKGRAVFQRRESRVFAPEVTAENLKICIDNIKIIHEATKDADFGEAWRILSTAERIFFLDSASMKRTSSDWTFDNSEPPQSLGRVTGLKAPSEIAY
jgi:hypothetical protein